MSPVLGLDQVCWAPDGRHVLTTAEFQVSTLAFASLEESIVPLPDLSLYLSPCILCVCRMALASI